MENLTPEDIDILKQQMLVDALLAEHPAKPPQGYKRPAELTNPNSPRDDAIAQLMGPLAGEYSRKLDDTVSAIPDAAWSAIGGDMIEQGAKDSVKGFNEGDVSLAAKGTAQMLLPAAMPTRAFLPALGAAGALDLNEQGAFSPTEAYASGDQGAMEMLSEKLGKHGSSALSVLAPLAGGVVGGRIARNSMRKNINKSGQEAADNFKAAENATKAEQMHQKYPNHYGDINQRLEKSLPDNLKGKDNMHSSYFMADAKRAQQAHKSSVNNFENNQVLYGGVGGALAGQFDEEGLDSEHAKNTLIDGLLGAGGGAFGGRFGKTPQKSFKSKVKDINARGFKKPKSDVLSEALKKDAAPKKKANSNYRSEKANMQNRDENGNFIKGYKSDD